MVGIACDRALKDCECANPIASPPLQLTKSDEGVNMVRLALKNATEQHLCFIKPPQFAQVVGSLNLRSGKIGVPNDHAFKEGQRASPIAPLPSQMTKSDEGVDVVWLPLKQGTE